MADFNTPVPSVLPQEAMPQAPAPEAPAAEASEVPATEAPTPVVPVQVDRATFLAARLREMLAESANLRDLVADLQKENARFRANEAQSEINSLDQEFNVGQGTILQRRPDGTFWRIPPELVKRT